jgi:large repetitive protein
MRTRHFAAALAFALLAMPVLAAITGSVMTIDGAPVAGARVSYSTLELPEARMARLLSQTPVRVPAESTQTDAKGAFSLPSPKDAVVELRIEAAGYEPTTRRVERDEDAGAIALTLRESRKGTITSGGKPVPNATVVISYGGTDFTTRTDEQGRYDAPDVKRARAITVLHPDYALDHEIFMNPVTPSSEMNRTLAAGVKLAGRVVAADGTTPVANAAIFLDDWPAGTSTEDGTFTIAHAPAKWSALLARKDSLLAQRASDSSKASVTLKMGKASTISGRVTDAKTKVPVAGAFVSLGPSRRMMMVESATLGALTDAKGAWSIAAPAGAYTVGVSHPAFDLGSADVTVTAGQQAVKDISVGPLARISGVVVDEEQKPVVAAAVASEPAGEANPMRMMAMRGFRSSARTVTGPDGRFAIRVMPEQDLRLRATKRGLPQSKGETLRLAPAERKTGVVLLMPTGIAVTGRVKDANGEPLSGVSVTATETPAGRGGMMVRQFVMGGLMGEEEDTVRTASDGTFTLRVQEGTYDFSFKREGYAPKAVRAQTVTPQGGLAIETSMEPAVEVTGRVTRGGVGLADVNVSSFGLGDMASAMTGPDGSFTLGGLAPGPLRLMLRKDTEFVQEQRSVTAPARDVVFDLPAGGRVQGRVVEKGSSKPITNFQAGISTSRGGGGFVMMGPPQMKSFTSDDGSFVLENVPAGAMNIVAQAPGFSNGRASVDVEEGKTVSDVVIELDTGVKLTGKVTGPNGAALSEATVQIQPSPTGQFARSGSVRRAVTDSNGEYSIDSLDPGEETFEISHPKYLSTAKTVTLKGREMRMDVQLSGGQRVTGVVVTDSGMPVAEAEVEAFSASSGMERARTNATGQFEFASLSSGRYRFTASKSGYLEGVAEDVDVGSGGNVRIQLRTGGTVYGRVTGLSEQELSGASVTARSGRTSSSAVVDPSGNFRIEGAPTGTVQVSAATASRSFMERRTSGTQTVEVTAGSAAQVNLEFRSDTSVRGRITRNGVPLSGATVMFQPRGGSRASASTSADEAGSYTVSGLEEGEYTVMVADAQRFNPYQTTYHVRAGASTFDIDYQIASVRGRVLDAGTNEPIADATVNFRPSSTGGEMRFTRGAMTDPNGNFTMDSVSAGTYTVTASREGYGTEVREESFGDSGRDGFEIRLSRNDGVTLRVVDGRDGNAINAFVTVFDAAGRVVYEPGGMRFGSGPAAADIHLPLAPGSYTATVSMTGYATASARITSPSAAKQTVALTRGGTIVVQSKHSTVRRMRLLDSTGAPYPRFGNRLPSRDLLPGSVPIELVAPGSYTLQLLNDDESVADTVPVVVREGETTRVSL